MIDAPTYAALQDVIRREGRSLLQYVSEAPPWTLREARAALARVRTLIEHEHQAVGALVRLLTRHHLRPPYVGSYPAAFTAINDVSLDHLVPLLVEEQRRAIADLERDLATVTDPEARTLLEKILTTKQNHLRELEGLAPRPQAVAS